MKLAPIVAELRAKCVSFSSRVHASVEFADIKERTAMSLPCAFVLPISETADEPTFADGTQYRQHVEQSFGVAVFVKPERADRTGLDAFDLVEELKSEVFRALVGWSPDDDHDAITYEGMSILEFNRAFLAVQLEFAVTYDVTDEDTRHGVDLASLPPFDGVDLDVDAETVQAKAIFNVNGDY